MDLGQMLERAAARRWGKTAIIAGDRRLSYAELDKASNRLAGALIRMGVQRGDRVAMLLSNSPEFVTIFFGIVKAGAIAVPFDPLYKPDELAALFDDSLPKILIAENAVLKPIAPLLPGFRSVQHVIDVTGETQGRFCSYRQMLIESSPKKAGRVPETEDTASILYTSGPSLSPRGVMLSHRCLVTEAAMLGDAFQQTEKDIAMLYALPVHHVFGLVAVLLTSLCKGSAVVMVPGTGLSISSCMAAIECEKGTMFFGVPYIFALAADMAEKEGIKNDLSSLRLCSSSADFLPASLARRFKKLFGLRILDCFALTEAVCHVTCPPLDGSDQSGSVGKALPGWEVRIVDDDGCTLPTGQPGEIILRGPFTSGYYNNPQATAEVIRAGWLHTGDIGRLDQEGRLYIIGRKKDIVIVKGQNIYPGDVEAVLNKCPGIADAAVIGIPDEMRGEVVGAVVSLVPGSETTEQEIKRFCSERLASYKVPKQIFFMDSLPRTAAGGIDKASIRCRLSIPSAVGRAGAP